ncbi:glutathione S-transferase family protein [Thalassotalea ganghwensis]
MLTLYTHFNAVCGQKVHLLLHQLPIAYTLYPVNLRGGEQHSTWFKELNPKAQVPVLQDGTTIIYESNDICLYLDRKFNQNRFIPTTLPEQKKMHEWLAYIDQSIHPACSTVSWSIAIRPEMATLTEQQLKEHFESVPDAQRRDRQLKALKFGLKLPELSAAIAVHKGFVNKIGRTLVDSDYLLGPNVSLADIVTLPYVQRMAMLSLDGLWSDNTLVAQWFERMKHLPGYDECFNSYYPPGFIQRWHEYGKKALSSLAL